MFWGFPQIFHNQTKPGLYHPCQLLQVCSELSADLANIVEEEHYILDNPITSPPSSFPTELHRLDRLNITAQTDIIQAKGALEEYLNTMRQMTSSMELNQRNILEKAGKLEKTR